MHLCGKFYFFVTKWLCCTFISLTVACRIIASVGIILSMWLVIAFANDKFWFNGSNFDLSRKTVLILGLDWQHFHTNASLKSQDDPDGKMITIIIGFYSFTLLGTNLLLMVATIRYDWWFSLPWLIVEFLSTISKFGALIFHWTCDAYKLDLTCFIGSIAYLVISIWWWLVVFSAQITWRKRQKFDIEIEMFSFETSTRIDLRNEFDISPPKLHMYNGSNTDISRISKIGNK